MKNGEKKLCRKKGSKAFPMRTHIFASFLVFTAVVIGMLWLFQSVFMEDLYKSVRLRETEKCADELSLRDMEDAGSAATELGDKYGMCVSVYSIAGRRGQEIAEYHENAVCFIHNTSSDNLLDRLYFGAMENRGEYIESVPRMGDTRDDSDGESIIYAKLLPGEDVNYMIVLNTEIYPLSSTVSTMKYQLMYVSAALVAVAAVISIIMSHVMARPATTMSREAEKLALGNYDVTFDGGGYREMEGLADALNHAARELSGLDRMQKELIANVSHDLRTPLTLISGYSEVMRDIPGEMTAENMQIIIDETARLNSLVSDLLDVSRYMQGGKLEYSTFSLTEAVREAMGRYSRLIERDGYVIDFESDEEVFVRADKGRILQVIYNLVNNAVNYTGEDKRVLIRQTVKDGKCRVEVTDSGRGIPEDELPMIWERYYKSNAFHKRAALGTGLGLSIVKNILVSHKARFGVKSREGEGSTFWFELSTEC